ncbi:hypothetical protein COW36_15680 [bacterium (Candidatus Blackallbacteria) CG17_big_fil_post_rev_8_21_14_2_50_48_46]|uniref:Uncharacterized protein n=1 Tax=bacterium (Candidatus Blackallbacteria) CG17_big_fil_post_rev_8_21_14_2_50_48_46 TaxID=2014261 RepID=A0A2M7G1Z3_9BACT|nr:MAG: hypothetical protein COW64_24420 [bacterium (Candidatus Blackallbacteria) CG18_big_fil_WC_8_21_14_2_50_49_26]PIW15787.1 MAG: hypothetical protein COW36_15680 [bacterium (Candidatus Blackallbacteria) CG17_big_fil_post_rev_8_21_14_2_50_48_46]PIW47773.1 MAG: hypothetical protein COW20_11380 [bacterium (Candidatus Blackallbacteria) CG13_big_fil_rev_8_21_14_2_50_49_14]
MKLHSRLPIGFTWAGSRTNRTKNLPSRITLIDLLSAMNVPINRKLILINKGLKLNNKEKRYSAQIAYSQMFFQGSDLHFRKETGILVFT